MRILLSFMLSFTIASIAFGAGSPEPLNEFQLEKLREITLSQNPNQFCSRNLKQRFYNAQISRFKKGGATSIDSPLYESVAIELSKEENIWSKNLIPISSIRLSSIHQFARELPVYKSNSKIFQNKTTILLNFA